MNPNKAIDPSTTLGPLHLKVAELQKLSQFYQKVLGMSVLEEAPSEVRLGVPGRELLVLHLLPSSRKPERAAGLYHFCIKVEERLELGRLLKRVLQVPEFLQGLVDHHISEAIYLQDPEGNGIELDWDRARSEWPKFEELFSLGNGPLDSDGLLALVQAKGPGSGLLPADASIGHIHLHVAQLQACRDFYHGILGFDIMGEFPRQAVFTSAGGYHHHIAFNVWHGLGAPPAGEGAAGLDHFVVTLASEAARREVLERVKAAKLESSESSEGVRLKDPSQNTLVLAVA